MKQSKMHPNTTRRTKTLVSGPMGWIGCVRCEKFQCDFMPRTCALIPPFQPTLYRVSYSNKTLQNAPKHYETHQNMSLGSNGVDQVHSLWKCLTWLHGTNFFHLLHQFSPNCTEFRKVTKQSKMHPNTMNVAIHEFRVQWSESGAFVAKNSKTISWHELVH